ncbi:MAG TPA: type II toxin-antitoxin system RelE/ParE family toxin [Tepidisphaeraceae bacterium]|nr:type II toxin-antitoxin system RelE/ParE family toxin [Tepidisphaeraceae bacterium]
MQVALSAEAAEDYGKLPRSIQPRIDNIIRRLAQWPEVSGVKPLVGRLAGNFRIRTGDYRIVFRVAGDKVIVWKLGDRKDVYLD